MQWTIVELEFYIWTKLKLVGWTCAEGRQKGKQSIKQMNRCEYIKKQDYNETALATIAIVPDDGPMWPKHVVLV
jgi:hypothetical protein